MMDPITKIRSKTVVLPHDDIDTDQIIPARFLRTTGRTGLGQHLFEDWRYDASGMPRNEFVLNDPGIADAHILLAGRNFGCGSSREHAVWALLDFGVYVVIAQGFADIFRKNSLRNGLLTISVNASPHRRLLEAAKAGEQFVVDLEAQTVTMSGNRSISFDVDPFSKTCMLAGVDELEYILRHEAEIGAFERARAAS